MPTHLVVSFIGDRDLDHFRLGRRVPESGEISPIVRLLMALSNLGCPPRETSLLLFDDDRADGDGRAKFCEALRSSFVEMGLEGLTLHRERIVLENGPTDRSGLYRAVWRAIPTYGPECPDEVIFHLSSGTPAMQATLMLAAKCLPLKSVRLFETSREKNVEEVVLPYELAARKIGIPRDKKVLDLPEQAKRQLLQYTVIDDPVVESEFATLYNAATVRRGAGRVLILGPTGSGKWHAARQFAKWRGCNGSDDMRRTLEWYEPIVPDEAITANATILIRHLDVWSHDNLEQLSRRLVRAPDIAVAATWRSDANARVRIDEAKSALRGAHEMLLPALSARVDRVGLAKAVARQLGYLDGKIDNRLQHDLLSNPYLNSLHDLRSLISATACRSEGRHPDRAGMVRAMEIKDAGAALALLHESWDTLAGLRFGSGRPRLDEVIDVMHAAVVCYARAAGRSQKQVGELLGYSQQKVSAILKQRIDLNHWRALLSADDESND